jgi:phosphoenolpyruvate-protein kinase (PTS system EI component)
VAFEAPAEANPFLGWRSIRVCLDHPEIFRPQLRALLRAAVHGNLRAMLPLITRVDEMRITREILAEEADALRRSGIPAAATLPLGAMMETPAAAVIADRLARVISSASVPTTHQYTLAVDRNARLVSASPPGSVGDPPARTQLTRRRSGDQCGVCGEMASSR